MEENYTKLLHKYIPGGSHTYSRGDDQFPNNAPSILDKQFRFYVKKIWRKRRCLIKKVSERTVDKQLIDLFQILK